MIPSYTKIVALGHRAAATIFDEGRIEVTEKLDGSQFAFGLGPDGELYYRSKGRQIPRHSVQPNDLFYPVVQHVEDLYERGRIPEGFWFYGETLARPRHSTLRYERVPRNHFALFGVTHTSAQEFYPYLGMLAFAEELEVDVVPLFPFLSADAEAVVHRVGEQPESCLGGCPMEGLVVRNLDQEMLYGPVLFPFMSAKYVSEKFKEVHQKEWSAKNTGKGKWAEFKEQFSTEARWWKAVQHKIEAGELLGEPKDIGSLIIEVQKDIGQECKEEIVRFLWKEFGKELLRESTRGLAEWYKEQIALGEVDRRLRIDADEQHEEAAGGSEESGARAVGGGGDRASGPGNPRDPVEFAEPRPQREASDPRGVGVDLAAALVEKPAPEEGPAPGS